MTRIILFGILVVLTSCGGRKMANESLPRETVLREGMSVYAKAKDTWLRVSYIDLATRKVESESFSVTRKMKIRVDNFEYEGFIGRGILGIYDPGETGFFTGGGKRLVYMESERHFGSEEEMNRSLVEGSAIRSHVCSEDGLVLSFAVDSRRNSINVCVWQLYINGKKPRLSHESNWYTIGAIVDER